MVIQPNMFYKENKMDNTKYFQDAVARTAKSCETQEVDGQTLNVLHWALGLSGEVGEIVDPIKKHVFYNQPLDVPNIEEELGDVFYYCLIHIKFSFIFNSHNIHKFF